MTVQQKLAILSDAAKYDASCSSSGSSRKNRGGTGEAASSGICHSWTPDGRCVSLLKILFTNRCVYDCAYCVSRCSNDLPRTAFTPEEVVELTMNFYRRNCIEGLFLSSAVEKSPDYTMERLDPKTAWALRHPERFPVDVNRADYEELLRVPGIGFRSAQRMVTSRRIAALRREDLPKFGVVMKRAQFFITCAGRDPLDALRMPRASVRQILMASNVRKRAVPNQLELNLT
jgi:predicted DNA-binding helix-hairpin-helix protein